MKELYRLPLYFFWLSFFVVLSSCSTIYNGHADYAHQKKSSFNVDDIGDMFIRNNLLEEIKAGDFTSLMILANNEWLSEELIRLYTRIEESGYKWIEFDLNEDGINELILQGGNNYEMNRIICIFVFNFENQETELVYYHNADLLRFLFLSRNGNTIWYHFTYGTYNWNSWSHCVFDDEWNRVRLSALNVIYIYDLLELPDDWAERNPDMVEVGVYFRRYAQGYEDGEFESEMLDEQQFLEAFEEMMGFSFYEVTPDWFNIFLP
ncbi:MAG: hypothetical protein LBI27_01820 [Clostridiales bacterium]|jgi:hypothetical protein|nr:hypothetical protein [Clostridiales bacterium]